MATLKAKLKRVLDPPTFVGSSTRTDTIFDFTEPLNGWEFNYDNATLILDWTMLGFREGAVSYVAAIRCTNVLSYWDGYMINRTRWGATEQLGGASDNGAHCQLWPCCAMVEMQFPKLYAANDDTSEILTPNLVVGTDPGAGWDPHPGPGIMYLQLEYGSNASVYGNLKIYTSIDMQLYVESA
jgi:hypothetical protein